MGEVVSREQCPKCGSRDNVARYADGGAHCFTPGCGYFERSDGSVSETTKKDKTSFDPVIGSAKALPGRRLSEQTCALFGYQVSEDPPYHVANFREDGKLVGQKLRFPGKRFSVKGDLKNRFFGQELWQSGRKLVITEGEIDAMSVSQAQGNKWPVVSLPNGAQSVAKTFRAQAEWLGNFEEIILMFDQDEAGAAAVKEAVKYIQPGRAKIATLPLKDASDMLKAHREAEIVNAIWRAKTYRPDGIVTVDDVIDKALEPVVVGLPWCFETLTKLTYGRRRGEVYGVGAGTGSGKTDFLTQQVAFDIDNGIVPAVFFLEQLPEETLARVAGKRDGRAYHIPEAGWTDEERKAGFEALKGKLYMYDSFGANEWDVIKSKIRYLAVAEGVFVFYLDHLTALADTSNERESIEQIMKELASMAVELRIIVTFVSHLSTPEGKPHEEGGRVMIRHFKGSRSIGFWSHYLFGLERDQQADEVEKRHTTTFRVLKDRKTGQATGEFFHLKYDPSAGRMVECDAGNPFGDDDDDDAEYTAKQKEDF